MQSTAPISIIGRSLASLAFATCLRQQGIAHQIYAPKPSKHKHGSTPLLLAPRTVNLLHEISDLGVNEVRKRISLENLPVERRVREASRNRHCDDASVITDVKSLETLLSRDLNVIEDHLHDSQVEETTLRLNFGWNSPVSSSFTVNGAIGGGQLRKQLFKVPPFESLPFISVAGTQTCSLKQYENWFTAPKGLQGFRSAAIDGKGHKLYVQAWRNRSHSTSTLEDNIPMSWLYSRRLYKTDTLSQPDYKGVAPVGLHRIIEKDLRMIYHLMDTPWRTLFKGLDFTKNPPYLSLLKSYVVPRPELDRLSKLGLVCIGAGAHVLPSLGPFFGADQIHEALLDGQILAGHVANYGANKDTIDTFYTKRFNEWQASRDTSYEMLVDLHRLSSGEKDGIPLRRIAGEETNENKLKKLTDKDYIHKVRSPTARAAAMKYDRKHRKGEIIQQDTAETSEAGEGSKSIEADSNNKAMEGDDVPEPVRQAGIIDISLPSSGMAEEPPWIPAALSSEQGRDLLSQAPIKPRYLESSSPPSHSEPDQVQPASTSGEDDDPPIPISRIHLKVFKDSEYTTRVFLPATTDAGETERLVPATTASPVVKETYLLRTKEAEARLEAQRKQKHKKIKKVRFVKGDVEAETEKTRHTARETHETRALKFEKLGVRKIEADLAEWEVRVAKLGLEVRKRARGWGGMRR